MVNSYIDILKRHKQEENPGHNGEAKSGNISLNLTPTPISSLPRDELIIYLNDRLYYLSISSANLDSQKIGRGGVVNLNGRVYLLGSFLELGGNNYSLIESESFADLEKGFLNENKKEIDSFRKTYIKRLAQQNSTIREKYDLLERSLKNDDSLDSLVRNYFFPITKGIDLEKIISENKKRELFEKKVDISKIKDIQFNNSISFFYELISDKDTPILITSGEFYYIQPKQKFAGRVIERVEDIEIKYKRFILKKIKEKIKDSVDSYFKELSQGDKGLKNLSEEISSATSRPHKDFGAERISDEEYVLFKNTGEYGVEWDGEFYLFPPIKIGIGLVKNSRGYRIDEKAFVYQNPDYKHPYVYGGTERGSICTAGQLDLIHSQIGLDSTSSKDKAYLMKSVKYLLNKFEAILKRGHNSNHFPNYSIQDSARLLSSSEVKDYKRRGVEFFPKIYGN